MSSLNEAFRQIAERAEEMYGGIISVEQERSAVAFCRPYLMPILRARQDECCWFCEEPLPEGDGDVDIHHVVPLHVAFPHGFGYPSRPADLRVVHRACHRRQLKAVR